MRSLRLAATRPTSRSWLNAESTSRRIPSVNLDWETKSIVWLDYDGKLDEAVLSDITTVAARSTSGSVVVISVNVQVEGSPDEIERQAYAAETGLASQASGRKPQSYRRGVSGRTAPF